MNTKQLSDWNQLVRQCKTQCARRPYNSINVASTVRSEAIVAADALVELVTPELAALLEGLAYLVKAHAHGHQVRVEQALTLAARIREALGVNDEKAR